MERAFGTSFADVELRTDTEAGSRARSLGARAYTDGTEIGFAPDVFRPETPQGLFTIAHEFAHVVQGRGGMPGIRPTPPALHHGSVHLQTEAAAEGQIPTDPAEENADAAAMQVLEGSLPDVKPFVLDATAPAKQDPKQVKPLVIARGTYVAGKTKAGGYVFGFNSQDVRTWTDSTVEFYSRYIHHVFPSASADDVTAAGQSLQIHWTTPFDPLALDQTAIVRYEITPSLHQGTREWFLKNRPAVTPSSPTPGEFNLDQKPGKAPAAPPADTVKTTASSTGAESQGLMKVEQLYDYLFKKLPDHPMFKERGAKLEDLIQYLAKQGGSNAPKITDLSKLPPDFFQSFMDQWAQGKTSAQPDAGGAGSAEQGIHKFVPEAKLAIYPKVEKYVTGASMRAVVEFKSDDYDNASINVFPGRALFHWSIRDSAGKEIDSGPILEGRGDIDYSFKAPAPGIYSIHVRVTSEYFTTVAFSPTDMVFTSDTEAKRESEVFESTLLGKDGPLERVNGQLKFKQDAGPAATVEGEAEKLKKMLEQVDQLLKDKQIEPEQATEYRNVINERLEMFEKKQGVLTGTRAYRAYGTLLDRETSESMQLQFIARGGVQEKDGKKTYTMQLLDVTSSSEEPPVYGGEAKVELDTAAAMRAAEVEAIDEAEEQLRAQNSYPNGTIHMVVELSDGTTHNATINTANARKKAKAALGVASMTLGAVALVASPLVGETSAPAGVALIEAGSALGVGITIAGAAAGAAALGDIGLRIEQRTKTGTMHADRTTAIDAAVAVTTIAGFGGIAKLAKLEGVAKVLSDGRLLVATTSLGVGQGILMSMECRNALSKIETSYALQMAGKSQEERAKLLQQRDQEEGALIASFAVNGGFLVIATAHGVAEITTHGFMPGPHGEPPVEYTVSERVKAVADNRDPVEIRETLSTDRALSKQERAFLQEALSRATAEPVPRETVVKPEALPNAKSPAAGEGGGGKAPEHGTVSHDDTGLVQHGMTKLEARIEYNRSVVADKTREVGLYFNPKTGEYIVAQGSATEVDIQHLWKEGYEGVWVLIEHSHPGDDPFARLASPKDFQAMMHWQTTGVHAEAPVSTLIRWTDPVTKIEHLTEIGFRPGRPDGYYIKFIDQHGGPPEVTFEKPPWEADSDYRDWLRKRGVPDEPVAAAPAEAPTPAPGRSVTPGGSAPPAPASPSAVPEPLPNAEAVKAKPAKKASPSATSTLAPEITGKLREDIVATDQLTGMTRTKQRLDRDKMLLVPEVFPTPKAYLEFMQRDLKTAVARLNEKITVIETQAAEGSGTGAKTSRQMDFSHYKAPAEANLTREEALGPTPNRSSETGQKVIERMKTEGRISQDGLSYFLPQTNQWYPIAGADMGHIHDAVVWWNEEGYLYGMRSETVKAWMKEQANYELQPPEWNRREGAELGAEMRAMGLGYRRAHPDPIPTDVAKP
jgi:hypothetical protein